MPTETLLDELGTSKPCLHDIVNVALEVREFELTLLELFKQGLLSGTIHTCIGQEFCAAALHPHLITGVDSFFASHRGHGHYLAHGGSPDALLAELMGRSGALCLGRGGTQNLSFKRFFSAGIQGSSAPIAVGHAWASKCRDEDAIAVVQLGDGTLGEGAVYEAFTFAVLLKAPVLFLLESNGWAQSTDVRTTTPGDIQQRAAGFGLDSHWISDNDPGQLYEHLRDMVATVRSGRPFLQVIETRRLMAHSKGDDNRPKEYVTNLWRTDPLSYLIERDETVRANQERARAAIRRLAESVAARPKLEYIDYSALPTLPESIDSLSLHADRRVTDSYKHIADELNSALHKMMGDDPNVVLIGEDLLDPYGGAFKVSRGLSSRFPDQVMSTPIAEAGIVGMANGMALAGLRPIAEIMFADFVTLAADQLINFAAKYFSMYGGRVTCPLTVRLVSGGGRGYGPTHSQSLERLFCGIPGLRVVALSQRHDPGTLLRHVVLGDDGPTIFVEHKLLYAMRPCFQPPTDLDPVAVERSGGNLPPLCYTPTGGRLADATVVTCGGMTMATEQAMRQLLIDEEMAFDYFILTQLWPLDIREVVDSVRRTRRLVVIEENVADFGLGSAVLSTVAQQIPEGFACRAVGARPVPLPSVRHLEDQVLPSVDTIVRALHSVR